MSGADTIGASGLCIVCWCGLQDTRVQLAVLVALGAWLAEDHSRVEARLVAKDAVQTIITLYAQPISPQVLQCM